MAREKSIDLFKELSEQDKSYIDRLVNIANELRNLNKEKAIDLNELAELSGISTEPCKDCISREAAIHTIMGQPPEAHYPDWYAEQIKELPSVQPKEPRRKGKWIPVDDTLKCSECSFGYFPNSYFFRDGECVSTSAKRFIFKSCPVCGAKMEE